MAPPRKHDTDVILDAARTLVLSDGPRAASVAAIAQSSGAPAGTLYHRFGSRDGILTAAWLRALERFQARALAADGTDTIGAAVAMAAACISFARELPDDARLLLSVRPSDLLDGQADEALDERLATMNAPLIERIAAFARELFGTDDARRVDMVARAVVDLPYAALRRHAHENPMPPWLEDDVAAAARLLLSASTR